VPLPRQPVAPFPSATSRCRPAVKRGTRSSLPALPAHARQGQATPQDGYRHRPAPQRRSHLGVLPRCVKHLADRAGAHWLIGAIAPCQLDPRTVNNAVLCALRFWMLVVRDGKDVLSRAADREIPPAIVRGVGFTDFPLEAVDVWVERGFAEVRVALLAGER
jgi:hypothetical protein